jgi:hypothetical protein
VVFEAEPLSLVLAATVPMHVDGGDATSVFSLVENDSAVFALEQLTDGMARRRARQPKRSG